MTKHLNFDEYLSYIPKLEKAIRQASTNPSTVIKLGREYLEAKGSKAEIKDLILQALLVKVAEMDEQNQQ